MKANTLKSMLVIAFCFAWGGLRGADVPATGSEKSAAKSTVSAGDVKKDIEKFNAQRDAMLAERQKLVGQLKSASDEQRKAILEKMKELGEAQRELSKQLREDMRKQRAQGSPGRG